MLRLVRLSERYRHHLTEMMDEWTQSGEKIIPYRIRMTDYRNFDRYLSVLNSVPPSDRFVPDSTFFALDEDRDIFVGAVNIRHQLNEALLFDGGHIGDGIRPSERRKGFATEMICLALKECRDLGIHRILMCCDKTNVGSAKSIMNNGGILENEVLSEGDIVQRYWIHLDKAE